MGRISQAPNIFLFVLTALALLVAGCFGVQAWWSATHPRHEMPWSGYYRGSVDARFTGVDDAFYSFQFRGRSKEEWHWIRPTNFTYLTLEYEWNTYYSNDRSSNSAGTISLPSLAYQSQTGTGMLTRAILANWLLDPAVRDTTTGPFHDVDVVFDYINAAGNGSLPPPKHHGYHFENPALGRLNHFALGSGVGPPVYYWVGVWLLLLLYFVRKNWRKHRGF